MLTLTQNSIITHLSSRLLYNIFIPNIEKYINTNFIASNYALSSLMKHEDHFFNYNILCILRIKRNNVKYDIEIYADEINETDKEIFIKHISDNLYFQKVVLNVLLKLDFQIEIIHNPEIIAYDKNKLRIDLSVSAGNKSFYLLTIIPSELLILLFECKADSNTEAIESDIIKFFTNPINYFPDIKIILNTLSEIEIQKLFYHLQKKNMLTPYQLSLLLYSFPKYTTLIKNNLSMNIIHDIDSIMKKFKINKRDFTEGTYSIEEAVYMSMKNNDDLSFSIFLDQIQKWMKLFINSRNVIKNSFIGWLEEIDSSGHLYKTLSSTKEEDIRKAVSDNPGLYEGVLSRHLPAGRLQEILSVSANNKYTVFDRIESQANFISNYRKLRIKKLNLGYENFPMLLLKISGNEIVFLLLNVGWFVLSTALKGLNKKRILQLIDRLPLGSRYLIIDVIEGVVNPGILHDEIQINKARAICVNGIISLYEDGFIDLK